MAERPTNLSVLPPEMVTRILEYNENWNLFTANTGLMRLSIDVFRGRLEKHFHVPSQLREDIREIIRTESLPLVRIIYLLKDQYRHYKDLTDEAYRTFSRRPPSEPIDRAFDVLVMHEKTWYRDDSSWSAIPEAFVTLYVRYPNVVATINWGEDGLKGRMANRGMFVLIWMLLVSTVVTRDQYVEAGEPLHDTLWVFMENPGMVAQDSAFCEKLVSGLDIVSLHLGTDLAWKRRLMPSLIAFMALVPDNVFNDGDIAITVWGMCYEWSQQNDPIPGFSELQERVGAYH